MHSFHPLIGRATTQNTASKHLFASLGDGTGVFAEYDLDDTLRTGWQGTPPRAEREVGQGQSAEELQDSLCQNRLWQVITSGRAIVRNIQNDDALPVDNFETAPSDGVIGGTAYFKCRVSLRTVEGNKRFFMDLGEQIAFIGTGASVDVFGPANMLLVTPRNAELDSSRKSGLVVDAQIDATFAALEERVASRSVRFTQRVFVAAESRGTIAVPAYAKEVTVLPDPNALPAASWTRFIGNPATTGSLPVGTLDFDNGASRLNHRPIGDETHLRTDQDDFADRLFTLIWKIQP